MFGTLCSLKMLPGNILALLAREAVSPRILGLGDGTLVLSGDTLTQERALRVPKSGVDDPTKPEIIVSAVRGRVRTCFRNIVEHTKGNSKR